MVIDNLQHQSGDINHFLFNFLIHKSVLALSAETVLCFNIVFCVFIFSGIRNNCLGMVLLAVLTC